MHISFFRILFLSAALLTALPGIGLGQTAENASAVEDPPRGDTLATAKGPNPDELMKAKLDSLRKALDEGPERRGRAAARTLSLADSLCRAYDFPAAADLLASGAAGADSSLAREVEAASLRARAGLSMMGRVSQARVKARTMVSREDFFRMFPGAGEGEEKRFYSTSPDGNTMYFSSKDRSGAGGYDLYVSRRKRSSGEWSESVNMGFPYSSPYNDLLYADVGDGLHSVLVSDRDCPADSLNIYVLEYDPVPRRRAVANARDLRTISRLEPSVRRRQGPRPAPSGSNTSMSDYSARTVAVRDLRDSVAVSSRELDDLREGLASVPEEQREEYLTRIVAKELSLGSMEARLDDASRELQELEQEFLSGSSSPLTSVPRPPEAEETVAAAAELYLASEGGRTVMKLSEDGGGKPSTILPEGSFSRDVTFPVKPAYRVNAVIALPEGENGPSPVPGIVRTAIGIHTGNYPEITEKEGLVYVSAGPFHDRSKAGSLMMALRAVGVSDVSLSKD